VGIGAAVAHHPHAADGEQNREALPHFVIPPAVFHLLDHDAVGVAEDFQPGGRDLPEDADREARTGEGLAEHDFAGQPELEAQLAHLVLEKAFQRLEKLKPHLPGQAAHVVVALDHRRRVAANRHRLDHIRVERPLGQKPGLARAAGRVLENLDEGLANDLALPFGVGHALEPAQKQPRGVLVLQFDPEVTPEHLAHHLRLPPPQHAIVDEDAGELVANGFVNQRRRHAGIHPAA